MYLELCQKWAIGEDVMVELDGTKYYPKAYELSFDGFGNPYHRAILKDKKANSILYCKLEKVKEG
jgi:hypothetical protein